MADRHRNRIVRGVGAGFGALVASLGKWPRIERLGIAGANLADSQGRQHLTGGLISQEQMDAPSITDDAFHPIYEGRAALIEQRLVQVELVAPDEKFFAPQRVSEAASMAAGVHDPPLKGPNRLTSTEPDRPEVGQEPSEEGVEVIGHVGIYWASPGACSTSQSEIEAMLNVDLLAPILLTRAALPSLRAADDAMVVNVTSGIALMGAPFYATYAAFKAGLAQFGEALRRELKGEGIHVLTVYPIAPA